MRRAQPWSTRIEKNETFLKMTIVQNQRLNYFTSVAEHPVNLDEHVKVVNALPLRDVCGLLSRRTRYHMGAH